jgi:hypothetical protein
MINPSKNMSSRSRKSNKTNNKQPASSLNAKPNTIQWNVLAQPEPGFRNTIRKDNKVYRFQQVSEQGVVLTSDAALQKFFSKSFTSADILQFSSFAAVFDQYKIEAVEVWLTPYGPALATVYNTNGHIASVVDYDDANNPTSIANMQEITNCVTDRFNVGHYKKFRPHMALAAYGGAFTQFVNKPAQWIDCASTAAQHFGLKVGIEPTNSNADLKVDLITRITVCFRNVF